MKNIMDPIIKHSQRSVIYGMFGILGLLFVLLIVNEKNWRPLKGKTTWKVTSNYGLEVADFAIDGNLKLLWTSYAPMTSGMFFQVDIGTPSIINGLVLHVGKEKQGQPLQWIVKTSLDGEHWQTAVPRRHITYRSMLAILFTSVRAQYIQVIQTSIQATSSPWSIGELDLLQPIVPWQFEHFTLIFWIVGWLFGIVSFLLFTSLQGALQRKVLLAIILTSVVLLGWGLRIYDINAYELSAREFQHLSLLDFGKYTHTEWLKAYFDNTKTGTSWLALLFNRWAYQFFQEPRISLRIVSAIFGVCTIVLVYFLPKFLSGVQNLFCQEADKTSALLCALVSALVSVSGFFIVLSRRADTSVPLLFFILLYLVIAYRFLYRNGSYVWIPVLILLLFTGFFIDPTMGYVPIGIIVFIGGSYVHQTSCLIFKNHAIRLITFVLSALPLYVYWYIIVKWGNRNIALSFTFSKQEFWHELSRMLRFSGFTGIVLWVSLGIVLVGIVQLFSHKNHGEWFLYIQGIIFFILVVCFSSSPSSSPFLWIALLLIFLLAKGIYTTLKLGFTSKVASNYSFLVPLIKLAVFFIVVLYFAMFSINSLFFGSPVFPHVSELYEEYSRKKNIGALIQHIITDPDECRIVATLNEQLTKFFPVIYGIEPYFVEFSELTRLSELGRFWTYIFAPISLENTNREEITAFLRQYYHEVGKSSRISLYKLREEFYGQRQRYTPADLHHDTGHHIEDERSFSGVVRFATKDDPPGLLSFWPAFRICTSGYHIARFVLRSEGGTDEVVAILEVWADSHTLLARSNLKGTDFSDPTTYQAFDLPFGLDMRNPAFQMRRLQFLVHFTGKAEVRLDYIELIPHNE
jgi:hypothetical protein